MGISAIRGTNVFCFETFEMDIAPDGAIIEGGNGRGKTSVLKILRAALIEKGASPDMIRKGATSGEILVRVDNHFVRRVMTAGDKFKTTLRVTDDLGKVVPDGAAFLKNLLGLSPLDPIELFLERDKAKRRAKILSAIPCVVTEDQLASWCPKGANLVEIVGDDGLGGPALQDHGLEVIERARKVLYAKRTDANRIVREKSKAVDEAIANEASAMDALHAHRMSFGLPDKAPDLDHAKRAAEDARRAEIALGEQRRAAESSAKAQARTREKIGALRQKASDLRANQPIAPTDEQIFEAHQHIADGQKEIDDVQEAIRELERRLESMRSVLTTKQQAHERSLKRLQDILGGQRRAEEVVHDIADIEGQALELEQALGALPVAPSEADFVEAERRSKHAAALVEYARKSSVAATYAQAVSETRTLLRAAQEDATALDRSVKALADEAPAALLAAADGIKGLSIDGDDVFLDGVSLDQLSGQERLFFAIDVARRLNAKSRLLCVDGLEALDAEHRRVFIERATEGGYQLIATRVSDEGGAPVATPIHAS